MAIKRRRCEILASSLSLDACVARVQHPGAGAVVVMLGTVRDHTRKDGQVVSVTHLEYEAYVEMAEAVIEGIAVDVESAHPGTRVFVQHRTGTLQIGDTAVVVAVSSPHRKDAFVGCEAVIDRLKQDAPIWKREHGSNGVTWVGLGP
ncbi:MAG: molybdenum cofactor biosynthesis protein MoaE [Deltaproteobacteria bacterium]|nr:molybdenum cofactor biosynthesis protein MoaE [Deltaproteobacteria bacterium]